MIKRSIKGYLTDGTFYIIRDTGCRLQLIINGKEWHRGSLESIEEYIKELNEK